MNRCGRQWGGVLKFCSFASLHTHPIPLTLPSYTHNKTCQIEKAPMQIIICRGFYFLFFLMMRIQKLTVPQILCLSRITSFWPKRRSADLEKGVLTQKVTGSGRSNALNHVKVLLFYSV